MEGGERWGGADGLAAQEPGGGWDTGGRSFWAGDRRAGGRGRRPGERLPGGSGAPAGRPGKETAGGVGGVRARLAAPAVLAGGRAVVAGGRAGGRGLRPWRRLWVRCEWRVREREYREG